MSSTASTMSLRSDRGIAMVLALFLMSVLSVLAASLMFLSQTETYATMNYRMMSQARYAAEAGVQKAANFLLDTAQYAVPGTATDPLANYDTTKSPVVCLAGCPNNDPANPNHYVILSASSAQLSNYPTAALTPGAVAVTTAFNTAAKGTLMAGGTTLGYGTYATLIAMQQFESHGGLQSVVQTWEVTADGTITGTRNATVQVVAIVETPKVPASTYAAFATANTCGALTFSGNVDVDSYDSSSLNPSTGVPWAGTAEPTISQSGGNVGTNGNLNIGGQVDIYGNLSTPRTGVGACTQGNVTALEGNPSLVTGGTVQLPTSVTFPAPAVPAPSALPAVSLSAVGGTTCSSLGLTAANCSVDTSTKTVTIDGHGAELTLPSISASSQIAIKLVAGSPPAKYQFNSISLTGQAEIKVSATGPTQSALVTISGKNPDGSAIATPIDFAGGTFASPADCATCSNFDASMLQFIYGGTGTIDMTGNAGAAATIYAPLAHVHLGGTVDLYGSVTAATIDNSGTPKIHYDRRLSRDFYVAGHAMVGTFTWKRAS